ncbi:MULTISPECIES: putative bifunctional diguanylate cyclase/phosphodiesterase [Kamptonema]|uniref:putative bifunctional diguanylate cyclase/phosphodiesterase n=1 Tax=Kamptonema TaxID=1501433 RepID=UPI0001DAD292|nr:MULTISPECIES: EAL domain-containing response regulator [Kamptonema]CBN58835.1 putative Response regulator receiver modulated diguanylate cyclase/phosphodiesterase [Kamptonema sp. PCC 6506]
MPSFRTSKIILVVDDELSLERLIKQRFRKQIKAKELEFIFVSNGFEALSLLEASPDVDLILTDIRMPEMDGLTLLDKIKKVDPTLKAVVVSAYDELKNIRTAMNRGAFDFLTKPIDFNDLEITINKTLGFVREVRDNQRQLQAAQEQLRYQAFYDALTGLLNRNGFIEQIEVCIHISQEQLSNRFAILFLNLDRYQVVKFTLGHGVGEELLKQTARRLESCMPQTAIIARVGSDEFAILLKDISDNQQASNIASAIHRALETPFVLEEVAVSSTVSIGIAHSSLEGLEPEDLLRAADTAMHYAVVQSKGSTAVFNPGMLAGAISRLELEADLQRAVFNEQLHLNYQPIFSLVDEQIVGFEALVRWRHKVRGMVSPAEFIPVAEETGLILSLGAWVLSEAMGCLRIWLEQFPNVRPLSMSVNLSGIQLSSPDLVMLIEELLAQFSLSGESLKLEITESMFMENAGAAGQLLAELKAKQIQFSIDDFGTGYSSLSYLHHLPIDTLKIDREFISGMVGDSKDFDIVKTIIALAHSLELDVVAEGIETQEQLNRLRELGCEYGQGFFFSKPLDVEAAGELLASFN